MNEQVRQLEPSDLWHYFADLNEIPRASKKEERAIAFVRNVGESLQLPTIVDEAGNVIIRKPATAGMEHRIPVVLQSHLDMVHQKNNETSFDFDTQGIDMYVEGDWVKAKGTTLGADNGIGVAAILTLLASQDIPHPPLEALFTIDEETGMTGALALKGGLLHGKFLLNLDTEDDHELTIGCAGGIDVTASGNYKEVPPTGTWACRIRISGLTGGHSGTDIHKGRANANKLMNRLLFQLSQQLSVEIHRIDGGSLRNAIPRESVADIVVPVDQRQVLQELVHAFAQLCEKEYGATDPALRVQAEPVALPSSVWHADFQKSFIRVMYACPNGIYRMNPEIEGLVQSSNNMARVLVQGGSYSVQCLTRSSSETEKADVVNAITAGFELLQAEISLGGDYPGWLPEPNSELVTMMRRLYQDLFHGEPHVYACHAGLECGILGRNYPGMQMISFGPNITGAHSPDEQVQISSVIKFWSYLLETLKRIPVQS